MAAEGRTFHQINYALGQGIQNMLRSPLMSMIVISTMMIALSTLGFLLLLLSDLKHVSDELSTQLKIVVFLQDQQDINKLASDIEAMPGVKPPVVKITRLPRASERAAARAPPGRQNPSMPRAARSRAST